MNHKKLGWLLFGVLSTLSIQAQPDRWQQRIRYNMKVDMDVTTNRMKGISKIEYFNQSPDTLYRLFFHTYWNAFQPGSSMDVRSRELGKNKLFESGRGSDGLDWDERVKDRISKLTPNEIGYQRISQLTINSVPQKLKDHETILEVILTKPVLPKSKINIDLQFEAQVPLQIRRSGRDNKEGIRYSMSQWYPKMVEYDYQGWHANPYIAREFYGVWGDYDVQITIDKNYLVAAGGDLLNPQETGFGYPGGEAAKVPAGEKITWKWQANNVHDFMWAADPTYKLITRNLSNGPLIRIVYKKVDSLEVNWQRLADSMVSAYPIIARTFGAYPYKTYTFIQGGDGGMEYPMATLIKSASIGTAIHEWMHSWFQMMMGTNESLYPWMDEGFTDYATNRVMAEMKRQTGFYYNGSYRSYFALVRSGYEEPASTHSDHYNTNYAYSVASYSKGAVFLAQLGYIVSDSVLDKILLSYYNTWRFKHPNPNDFIRIAEKESGMELDWYKEYWINSTKTIDYAIGDINLVAGKAMVNLRRVGKMPMPVDVLVTYKDGTQELHTIPLNLMYGTKPQDGNIPMVQHEAWRWTHPEYAMEITRSLKDIKSIEIDPSGRLADVNKVNNKLVIPE
ncbi:MAG: M1 family metallopeptidase [Chitinophagaceae bacterium]|nr:M1 family metallopeptidase [Chitinophagaceae bacterium]MCA6491546.1 M1 family metallopeptidase [Chitinophagaceae bacterium]MCA6511331.1 M1 family metallopeptidase [Chitinophagaceae bacterium]